ncbi:MAG: Gfo/Idh/MocA family oxidoreductase [bacterium]|nr:Gfo/Idh/MocA family oxidoreductase [bacterium]
MKILVVGAGYWGPNIIRNLINLPEVEAVGVSDLDSKKACEVARKFPRTHVAPPAEEAFRQGYDATCIVTPVLTHAKLAELALDAGLDVFVEKPLTANSWEAKFIIEKAKRLGRILMVGHVFHYTSAVRTIVDLMESGELGRICYIDSVRINLGLIRSDVNVMWDLAPHDLSIFEAIIKRMPQRVSAIGACHVPQRGSQQETMIHMTLDYGEGCLGHIHVNWFSPVKQRFMIIAGDKKMAVYNDIERSESVKLYDCGMYNPERDTPAYPTLRAGDVHSPSLSSEEPLSIQLKEFLTAIHERRNPETDGLAGLRVVQIMEVAMQSIRENGRYIDLH